MANPSKSLNEVVLQFVQNRKGQKVGTGECFELADKALKHAGAKSASDYGEVTKEGDYVWGKEIVPTSVQPGDILQFRNFKVETNTTKGFKIQFPNGEGVTWDEFDLQTLERPHHTAIAAGRDQATGKHTILEQNVDGRKTVGEDRISLLPKNLSTRGQEFVLINHAWGQKVKKGFSKQDDWKWIDGLVRTYQGRRFKAEVTTETEIKVGGRIWAFRPEPGNVE
ncbi:hypothetical protein ACFL3S_05525 [Gemmatimonadota bacterium]